MLTSKLEIHTSFDGSFPVGCQEDAVPKSLVALISMIMDGPNIKKKDTDEASKTSNTQSCSIARVQQLCEKAPRIDWVTPQ